MDTTAVREFFGTELRRSRWFWLTGGGVSAVVLLGLTEMAQHSDRTRLTSNAFVLVGLALTVMSWLSSVDEFRRIRRLALDWKNPESGESICSSLESAARLIRAGTLVPFMIAGAFLCSLS